jgi:hypothetical protein
MKKSPKLALQQTEVRRWRKARNLLYSKQRSDDEEKPETWSTAKRGQTMKESPKLALQQTEVRRWMKARNLLYSKQSPDDEEKPETCSTANRAQTMKKSPKIALQQTEVRRWKKARNLVYSKRSSHWDRQGWPVVCVRVFWKVPHILVWLCIVLITGR